MHEILDKLSTEQLEKLNIAVAETLARRRPFIAPPPLNKANDFKVGQIVRFTDKQGKRHQMKIERINAKTVSGVEVDINTGLYLPGLPKTWRVSPSLLNLI